MFVGFFAMMFRPRRPSVRQRKLVCRDPRIKGKVAIRRRTAGARLSKNRATFSRFLARLWWHWNVAASAVVRVASARIVRTSAGEIDVYDAIHRAPDALLEGLHIEFISPKRRTEVGARLRDVRVSEPPLNGCQKERRRDAEARGWTTFKEYASDR
jgi:hypothetical protein